MSSINTYTDGNQLRYRVTVGRKTARGFKTATEAAQKRERGYKATICEPDAQARRLLAEAMAASGAA